MNSLAAAPLDASPLNILRSMRGPIVDARIAYPEVLYVEIKDSGGGLWQLATQDAEWSPADPGELVGRSVEDADIDAQTGELRCKLSDGSALEITPADREAEDDPPNWELITPSGVVLEFGPGVRWQIGRADSGASEGPDMKSGLPGTPEERRRDLRAAMKKNEETLRRLAQ